MPARFGYPCPGCRSTNNLHEPGCRFGGQSWFAVEKAYVDVLAALSDGPMSEDDLTAAVHGNWDPLHSAALESLKRDHRVEETDDGDLELVPPAERMERLAVPDREPIRTIYEKGSVPGCHDNAIFAMISFYEMVGFSWPETEEKVVEWLRESGTWGRGGFEEASPEQLVENKRHVYEEGYGWKEKAKAAKAVIDRNL